jgi:hypothetical protein
VTPKTRSLTWSRIGSYVIFTLALAVLWIFLLFPQWQTARELKASQNAAWERLEFQKKHLPLFLEIEKKTGHSRPFSFGLPKQEKFPLADLAGFREIFLNLARTHNLTAPALDPDLLVLAKGAKTIPVKAELGGKLEDFRSYLIDLLSLPYMSHFSEIDIRQTDKGMIFKISFYVIVG